MLKAGTCICPACANVFTEAYYLAASGTQKLGVTMRCHPVTNRPVLVPDDPSRRVRPAAGKTADFDGIPDHIDVLLDKDTTPTRMRRCCPHCGKNGVTTELIPGYGKVPTFVLPLSGGRSAGKTTWLKSISTPENFFMAENFPCTLDILSPQHFVGTQQATAGTSCRFLTVDLEGSPAAMVVLVDTAGENWSNPMSEILLERFCTPSGEYPGADGFIFLDPITNLSNTAAGEEKINAVKRMKCWDLLKGKPVAYVRSHGDRLTAGQHLVSCLWADERVPLAGRDTFRRSQGAEGFLQRLAVEQQISDRLRSGIQKALPVNSRAFVINSCVVMKNLDCYAAEGVFNIYDPLIWMLNRLGIFPLEAKEVSA